MAAPRSPRSPAAAAPRGSVNPLVVNSLSPSSASPGSSSLLAPSSPNLAPQGSSPAKRHSFLAPIVNASKSGLSPRSGGRRLDSPGGSSAGSDALGDSLLSDDPFTISGGGSGGASESGKSFDLIKLNKFSMKQKRRFTFDAATASLRIYTLPELAVASELPFGALSHLSTYPEMKLLHVKIFFKGSGLRPYELIFPSAEAHDAFVAHIRTVIFETARQSEAALAEKASSNFTKLSKMMDLSPDEQQFSVARNINQHMRYRAKESSADYLQYNVLKFSPHGFRQKRILLIDPEKSLLRLLSEKRKVKKEIALQYLLLIEILPSTVDLKLLNSDEADDGDEDDDADTPGGGGGLGSGGWKNKLSEMKKKATAALSKMVAGEDEGLSLLEAPAKLTFSSAIKQRPFSVIFTSSEDRANFCLMLSYISPPIVRSVDLPENAAQWNGDHLRRWLRGRQCNEYAFQLVEAGMEGKHVLGVHSLEFLVDGLGLPDGFEKEKLLLNMQMLVSSHQALVDSGKISAENLLDSHAGAAALQTATLVTPAVSSASAAAAADDDIPPPPPPLEEEEEYDAFLEELKKVLGKRNEKKRDELHSALQQVYPALNAATLHELVQYCLF